MASLPSTKFCIQLDCVGMARMPYPKFCIQLDCVGMARMPYPPTKKLLQMFCRSFLCLYMFFIDFRERPLQSFEHLLNEVVDVALIASVGFLDATVGDDHANRCGFVTHEASKSGER